MPNDSQSETPKSTALVVSTPAEQDKFLRALHATAITAGRDFNVAFESAMRGQGVAGSKFVSFTTEGIVVLPPAEKH